MRGNSHARFGRRPGETERSKHRHRAPSRPHLAGDALDRCRRRVQQDHPRPPRPQHRPALPRPPHPAHRRRPAHRQANSTGSPHLFGDEEHVEVEATWGIYQRMIAAYREPDRAAGRQLMTSLIDSPQPRRPGRPHRAHHPRPDPEEARRRRPGLLRPPRHQQRPDRGDQRPPRTPPRLRPRLPQPHQLHRQMPARDRRLQTPTTPSIVKSPDWSQSMLRSCCNSRSDRGGPRRQ